MDDPSFTAFAATLAEHGNDVDALISAIGAFTIETPSWGYGNSGTRFKVFPWPGAARTVYEKLADAAEVQRVTGVCPAVALHIPWDHTDDWDALARHAQGLGLRIGAINPNLFQDEHYRLGSLAHPDLGMRQQAIDHVRECIAIARTLG
ncbi:MAG: sugar isomerase, partial [Ktedonobacterales bacterium]|nr:sugar isomerase [Ktedonobacterales bacterium]